MTIMGKRSGITESPPAAVEDALARLGRNLRTARLRRRLRIQDVADRLGASRDGSSRGEFVYGRGYLDRPDAVELDPVELRLADRGYETGRMNGFFGTIRDSMPDYWGRLLIERRSGRARLDEFDYLMEGPDDRAGALGFGSGATTWCRSSPARRAPDRRRSRPVPPRTRCAWIRKPPEPAAGS